MRFERGRGKIFAGESEVFQPTTFGNYFLTRRLAVGGMAEVYAAKLYGADGFEKDIVIKQILPQYARDPEFVQSFVAEAKIAVTLSHANIVGIYELGRVDGTYFIAMEYVDGLDVFTMIDAARRNGEQVSPGAAAFIVEEVAKGLDYAHRKLGPDGKPLGVVHRDLSPRNVLISREGEVKILDFGIAKTQSETAAMPKTRAGVVKGTTGYMSPEQATGGEVDSRTDVYQAGLLLFELLTSQALFWRPDDNETRDLMRKHRVLKPSELAPSVPEELDRLVAATLTRDPNKRIQSAAELGAALARIRISKYPFISSRLLGEQVTRLYATETEQEEAAQEALPSTMELREALSQALAPDGPVSVETIATRAPSGATQDPKSSRNGESKDRSVAPEIPTPSPGPEHARSTTDAPPHAPEPHTVISPARAGARIVADRLSVRRKAAIAGAASFLIAVAVTLAWSLLPETQPAAIDPPALPTERVALASPLSGGSTRPPPLRAPQPAPPAPANTTDPSPPEGSAKAAPLVRETPGLHPTKDPSTKEERIGKRASKTRRRSGFALVSFGTKSCSSRVTVDKAVVARSTPYYDFKLADGPHTIMFEGTSCRIESPDSLQLTVPTVFKEIDVEAGTSLRIIADFDEHTVSVSRK